MVMTLLPYSISSKPSLSYTVKYLYFLYILMIWVHVKGTKESKWCLKATPWYSSNEKIIENIFGNDFRVIFDFLKAKSEKYNENACF